MMKQPSIFRIKFYTRRCAIWVKRRSIYAIWNWLIIWWKTTADWGRKNLKGFYDYPDKPKKKHLWHGLKDLYPQLDPADVDVEEIKNRFRATIALEAARCVEENVVVDVREADYRLHSRLWFCTFHRRRNLLH